MRFVANDKQQSCNERQWWIILAPWKSRHDQLFHLTNLNGCEENDQADLPFWAAPSSSLKHPTRLVVAAGFLPIKDTFICEDEACDAISFWRDSKNNAVYVS